MAGHLQPIWLTVPETASRVRQRIEAVLDAAKVLGLREGENSARLKGHLDHLLAKAKKGSGGHHAALPWPDVPAFVADLKARKGMASGAYPETNAERASLLPKMRVFSGPTTTFSIGDRR